jgi:hypothetical protein
MRSRSLCAARTRKIGLLHEVRRGSPFADPDVAARKLGEIANAPLPPKSRVNSVFLRMRGKLDRHPDVQQFPGGS